MKLKIILTILIGSLVFSFFVTTITTKSVRAATNQGTNGICFVPNTYIPGLKTTCDIKNSKGEVIKRGYLIKNDGQALGIYVSGLYKYGAGAVGAVAVAMLVFAAWQWMMASGNAAKIENAKDTIRGVLIGIALLFAGYLLMNSISERLVNFRPLDINKITGDPWDDVTVQSNPCENANATEVPAEELACGQSACVLRINGSLEVILGTTCDNEDDVCVYKQLESMVLNGDTASNYYYTICPNTEAEMGLGVIGGCECVDQEEAILNNQPPG